MIEWYSTKLESQYAPKTYVILYNVQITFWENAVRPTGKCAYAYSIQRGAYLPNKHILLACAKAMYSMSSLPCWHKLGPDTFIKKSSEITQKLHIRRVYGKKGKKLIKKSLATIDGRQSLYSPGSQSTRWAKYLGSMWVHNMQYPNLRIVLISGDQWWTLKSSIRILNTYISLWKSNDQ